MDLGQVLLRRGPACDGKRLNCGDRGQVVASEEAEAKAEHRVEEIVRQRVQEDVQVPPSLDVERGNQVENEDCAWAYGTWHSVLAAHGG